MRRKMPKRSKGQKITVITGFALKMGIALAECAVADKYLKLEDRRIGNIGFLL